MLRRSEHLHTAAAEYATAMRTPHTEAGRASLLCVLADLLADLRGLAAGENRLAMRDGTDLLREANNELHAALVEIVDRHDAVLLGRDVTWMEDGANEEAGPAHVNPLGRKLDAKSLGLAMQCGAVYDVDADKLLMGPQTRHDYARQLLADCRVTCGRCGKELSYDKFYRCSCRHNTAPRATETPKGPAK